MMELKDHEIVKSDVAFFLQDKLGYSKKTTYVYDLGGKLRFSIEPELIYPIPAPDILEAVEYLMKFNIHIYYIPENTGLRGYIKIEEKKYKTKKTFDTLFEVYHNCLRFVTNKYLNTNDRNEH